MPPRISDMHCYKYDNMRAHMQPTVATAGDHDDDHSSSEDELDSELVPPAVVLPSSSDGRLVVIASEGAPLAAAELRRCPRGYLILNLDILPSWRMADEDRTWVMYRVATDVSMHELAALLDVRVTQFTNEAGVVDPREERQLVAAIAYGTSFAYLVNEGGDEEYVPCLAFELSLTATKAWYRWHNRSRRAWLDAVASASASTALGSASDSGVSAGAPSSQRARR